jgi:predicted nucleic acid-binding protein
LIVNGAAISVITRIEVLSFPMTADERQQAEDLLDQFDEAPLQEAIVQRTILVRQQHRIRLPDAVIAATALERGVPLVTRNGRDFQGIPGLTLLNPFAS